WRPQEPSPPAFGAAPGERSPNPTRSVRNPRSAPVNNLFPPPQEALKGAALSADIPLTSDAGQLTELGLSVARGPAPSDVRPTIRSAGLGMSWPRPSPDSRLQSSRAPLGFAIAALLALMSLGAGATATARAAEHSDSLREVPPSAVAQSALPASSPSAATAPPDTVPLSFGVSDDFGKLHPCEGAFLSALHGIGYTVHRMTVAWDSTRPTLIWNRALLDQAISCEQAQGIRVLLTIYPYRATALGSDPSAQASFAAYAAEVATTFPTVRDFIVGNEPNQPLFQQPQFVGGQPVAGRDYEAMLAQAYDAIKAVRPDANVIGFEISSRGNDNPTASSNISRSPILFIHDAADAYRASGRTRPIMDEFGFHPYPNVNTDRYTRSMDWPHAGVADLDRIKQALWDGFHGTAQPTVAEQSADQTTPAAPTLPILISEVGTETDTIRHDAAYGGTENVPVVSQAVQADYDVDLMEIAACDPSVEALLFYPLV